MIFFRLEEKGVYREAEDVGTDGRLDGRATGMGQLENGPRGRSCIVVGRKWIGMSRVLP